MLVTFPSHTHTPACRTYGSFTMETILAVAFGRVIDLQHGEADQLTDACAAMFSNVQEGNKMSGRFIIVLICKLFVSEGREVVK